MKSITNATLSILVALISMTILSCGKEKVKREVANRKEKVVHLIESAEEHEAVEGDSVFVKVK